MRPGSAWPAVLLLATAMAGCSGSPAPPPDDGLVATAETGIVRGVVVDQGIRPLPGAQVTLLADPPRSMASGEDGSFGFGDVLPGTYQVQARKPGYVEATTTVEVEAAVDEPRAVNLMLAFDAGLVPFVDTRVFEGFVECSTYLHTVGYFAACAAGPIGNSLLCQETGVCLGTNVTNDRIYAFVPVDGLPTFVQGEMVWESTQQFGQSLTFYLAAGTQDQVDGGGYEQDMNVTTGPSPIFVTVDGAALAELDVGTTNGLVPHIVAAAYEPTVQCLPAAGCEGVGFAAEQRFTVFLHLFYNQVPTPGWRFSADGPPPPPA